MDDFNKPIRPFSKKDEDEIRIEPINPVSPKLRQPEFPIEDPSDSDKKSFLTGTVLFLLRKLFNCFVPEKVSLTSSDAILEDIQLLMELLIQIRDEDPADDPLFAEKFSRVWHRLIDHYHFCIRAKKPSILQLSKVKEFIDTVKTYPPDADHSLAYYLTKYTEKEWFPIPFFHIITNLHQDFFSAPNNNALSKWIKLLEDLLKQAHFKH